ncbi:hypothetical protein K376_04694 [Streptomyces sp. PsTaAH-130]|nr:hypothetical protein K376_04694 [Streptomyces sp. PsTaAH-130]
MVGRRPARRAFASAGGRTAPLLRVLAPSLGTRRAHPYGHPRPPLESRAGAGAEWVRPRRGADTDAGRRGARARWSAGARPGGLSRRRAAGRRPCSGSWRPPWAHAGPTRTGIPVRPLRAGPAPPGAPAAQPTGRTPRTSQPPGRRGAASPPAPRSADPRRPDTTAPGPCLTGAAPAAALPCGPDGGCGGRAAGGGAGPAVAAGPGATTRPPGSRPAPRPQPQAPPPTPQPCRNRPTPEAPTRAGADPPPMPRPPGP